jgi:hypothetical protein
MKIAWEAQVDTLVKDLATTLGVGAVDPKRALASLKIWVGTSKSNHQIIAVSKVLREILERHGAIVLPQSTTPGSIDEVLVREQLKFVDLIAMIAITPGVSAEALEICTTDKRATDKMIVYMPDEYRDGFIYDVLTTKYKAKVRTFALTRLEQEEDPSLCGRMFTDALAALWDKKRKEKLQPLFCTSHRTYHSSSRRVPGNQANSAEYPA